MKSMCDNMWNINGRGWTKCDLLDVPLSFKDEQQLEGQKFVLEALTRSSEKCEWMRVSTMSWLHKCTSFLQRWTTVGGS